ncbi:hypothetical protein PDE_04336 [Penicillium oxalicum 114-2]|uniref:Helicase ATP-binding domain-containing protein n=1 Tax=Penicillium oxalicum (strain 114-2 / CGMCC 5302) TaxID=933388 RepID=S8B4D6_PENO1|nr:hypothetical protein PDE_04336 [Penicillium oxalicum 114-2]
MSEEDVFMSEAMSSHSDMPLEDINRTPTFKNPSPNPEIESDTDFIEPPGNPELWLSRPEKSDRYLALKLPPMHTLEDIFEDIASKAMSLGFADVLKHLNGRPLRIATVCSGTESPILAMEMLQKALGEEEAFRMSHVFSCEIVPFKQAYIERNFKPPILFRDILELGGDVAHTAYGALVSIPGDIDLLLAGTACVDFSTINNKRKLLSEEGESSSTFNALLRYAKKYRPRIVILENVSTAPWDKFADVWTDIDYCAAYVKVDSKSYYLPQTRMRGYLIAIDKRRLDGIASDEQGSDSTKMSERFSALMTKFVRQASSPAGMFLLPENDRRLEQVRKDIATRVEAGTRSDIRWERYQVRHTKFREERELGDQRPISRSQPGGFGSTPPDHYWRTWFAMQPERVWETLDMKFLQLISQDIDFNFKERCIDLSQGVDRGNESVNSSGVVGCITPCGMPFMSTRGGPISGLEALALQGLPSHRINLTSESQRDLQDLAGNAMTSTAVCAVMLSALLLGYPVLDEGTDEPAEAQTITDRKMDRVLTVEDAGASLVKVKIPEYSQSPDVISQMIEKGAESAQYCACEGQSMVKDPELLRCCSLCGHRACDSCAGNPTHAYRSLAKSNLQRSSAKEFIAFLKNVLPMRLQIRGLKIDDFDEFIRQFPMPSSKRGSHGENAASQTSEGTGSLRGDYIESVKSAIEDEVLFFDIERSHIWTVIYESKYATLKLQIRPEGLQWLYFAKAPRWSPARCFLREILDKPIARLIPKKDTLLRGLWELADPLSKHLSLSTLGMGEEVPAFPAVVGITEAEKSQMRMWTQIKVDGGDEVKKLDVDIRGIYDSLPDCGTAMGSMYKKQDQSIYLFLDPRKIGSPEKDGCVFAHEHRRLSGYEKRLTIAQLSCQWRATDLTSEPSEVNAFYRRWIKAPAKVKLKPVPSNIAYESLSLATPVYLTDDDCYCSYISLALLTAPPSEFGLASLIPRPNVSEDWQVLRLGTSELELREAAWAVQGIASRTSSPWATINVQTGQLNDGHPDCPTCDPPVPGIIWGRDKQGRVTPYEDPQGAAVYERAVKCKPAPFMILGRICENQNIKIRVALNVQSLAHQAYGRLVQRNSQAAPGFQWRLVNNTEDWGRTGHSRFTLLDNTQDRKHYQPPNFLLTLRQDQLRSLRWMVGQESSKIMPFIEEETEEASLPLMSWRAEVKVTMPRLVRGGVLCDEVGYGKTAIILGLIDVRYELDAARIQHEPEEPGLIPTRATILVVPYNVFKQWADEISKFLGDKYKVLRLGTQKALNNVSVKQIREADIILIPWSIFHGSTYYQNMRYFTGTPKAPNQAGRNSDSWFTDACRSLRQLVQVLQDEGPEAYLRDLWSRRLNVRQTEANSTYVPSRRLRGAAFVAHQAQLRASAKEAVSSGNHSSGERSTKSAATADASAHGPWRPSSLTLSSTPSSTASAAKAELPAHLRALQQPVAPDDDSSDESEKENNPPDEADNKAQPDPKTARKKAKREKSAAARGKPKKAWDDRKHFNIPAPHGHQTASMEDMQGLPLHAFKFNRVVVDEYTYSREERNLPILSLEARSKWILSGTPALDEFADVKDIARHLGIHLGIDDDGDCPTANARLKASRRRQTAREAFETHQPPRSMAWYENRRRLAQEFLDRFARQNIADVSAIPIESHVKLSGLSSQESEIYHALYDHFVATAGMIRKVPGAHLSAAQMTMNSIVAKSKSPAEALLKCIAVSGVSENPWSEEECTKWVHVQTHTGEAILDKLETALKTVLLSLVEHKWLSAKKRENTFFSLNGDSDMQIAEGTAWRDERVGDVDTAQSVEQLLLEVWQTQPEWLPKSGGDNLLTMIRSKLKGLQPTQAQEAQLRKAATEHIAQSQSMTTASGRNAWDLDYQHRLTVWRHNRIVRDSMSEAWKLIRKIVDSRRELRFFDAIETLTRQRWGWCDRCEASQLAELNTVVLLNCGHSLCLDCAALASEPADRDRVCVVPQCHASAPLSSHVSGQAVQDARATQKSSKLNSMVDIIKAIPDDEKAVLFVQYEDVMTQASRALSAAGIQHCMAKTASSAAITDFVKAKDKSVPQQPPGATGPPRATKRAADGESKESAEEKKKSPGPKVLILRLGSVMAAGLNLQLANHVLFLSPLLTSTQHDWASSMAQAIGRCRRYGQERTVHVYHLLARETVEVNVFQERTGTVVVEREGFVRQVEPAQVRPSDKTCEGDTLDFGFWGSAGQDSSF